MCVWGSTTERIERARERWTDGQGEGTADPKYILSLSFSLSLSLLCNTHDSCWAQRGWYHAHVLRSAHSHTYTAYQSQGNVSSDPQPMCSGYCVWVYNVWKPVFPCAPHTVIIHGCYAVHKLSKIQYKVAPKNSASQSKYRPCVDCARDSWCITWEQMSSQEFLSSTHDAPVPLRLPVNWWKRTDSSLDSTSRTIFNWLVLRDVHELRGLNLSRTYSLMSCLKESAWTSHPNKLTLYFFT